MNSSKASLSYLPSVKSPQSLIAVKTLEEKFKSVDEILYKKSLSPQNISELMGFVKLIRSIELVDGDEDVMDVYDNYIDSIEERMSNVYFHMAKKAPRASLQLI